MFETNRPQIRCGSVKVTFLARRNLAAVPVVPFNNPRGTILVSSVEATMIDLVGHMNRAGGLDRVAGALWELADNIVPQRLFDASHTASIRWAQRLGYLLEHIGAGELTVLHQEHVQKHARNSTELLPDSCATNETRSSKWKLLVHASVEVEA